jgi:hypothetical protein
MFTPLTSVSIAHHQDSGLVQAKARDRARDSSLIHRSAFNRTDIYPY